MSGHTPGPWRWEINSKGRNVDLCGGVPKFDLSVLDFVRWGMGSATPRFRGAYDIMAPAEAFAVVAPGREHHAEWFKLVDHPDARLISAAPDLLEALEALFADGGGASYAQFTPAQHKAAAAIAKAKGTP